MDRDRLTEEEIIRLAANRNPLPDGQQPPEVMLFYMLTGLYSAFYNGTITKEAAAMEKRKILGVCERFRKEYEQFLSICREYQQRLKEGYSVGGVTLLEKEERK